MTDMMSSVAGASTTSEKLNHLKIFVGNLPFDADQNDVQRIFRDCGDVVGVNVSETEDILCISLLSLSRC